MSIRANRSGTSWGSRSAFWATRISVADRAAGVNWASARRETVLRSARPRAISSGGTSSSIRRSRNTCCGIRPAYDPLRAACSYSPDDSHRVAEVVT